MYKFYLAGELLPITPSKLTMKINNRNETASLVDDTTINRLKAPGLTDIALSFEIPVWNVHPGNLNTNKTPAQWSSFIEHLKTNRAPFRFIVTRTSPDGTPLFDTNINVSLEDYQEEEDAENGDDLVFTVNLKTYAAYNTTSYSVTQSAKGTTKVTAVKSRPVSKVPTKKSYTVKSGDTLWLIARKQYGDGNQWSKIYTANKSTIEATAKKHGRASSSNGWWIYPGEVLSIP